MWIQPRPRGQWTFALSTLAWAACSAWALWAGRHPADLTTGAGHLAADYVRACGALSIAGYLVRMMCGDPAETSEVRVTPDPADGLDDSRCDRTAVTAEDRRWYVCDRAVWSHPLTEAEILEQLPRNGVSQYAMVSPSLQGPWKDIRTHAWVVVDPDTDRLWEREGAAAAWVAAASGVSLRSACTAVVCCNGDVDRAVAALQGPPDPYLEPWLGPPDALADHVLGNPLAPVTPLRVVRDLAIFQGLALPLGVWAFFSSTRRSTDYWGFRYALLGLPFACAAVWGLSLLWPVG